jgi:hypothetical protein
MCNVCKNEARGQVCRKKIFEKKKNLKLLLFFYFLATVLTGMARREEFKINRNKNCSFQMVHYIKHV